MCWSRAYFEPRASSEVKLESIKNFWIIPESGSIQMYKTVFKITKSTSRDVLRGISYSRNVLEDTPPQIKSGIIFRPPGESHHNYVTILCINLYNPCKKSCSDRSPYLKRALYWVHHTNPTDLAIFESEKMLTKDNPMDIPALKYIIRENRRALKLSKF